MKNQVLHGNSRTRERNINKDTEGGKMWTCNTPSKYIQETNIKVKVKVEVRKSMRTQQKQIKKLMKKKKGGRRERMNNKKTPSNARTGK